MKKNKVYVSYLILSIVLFSTACSEIKKNNTKISTPSNIKVLKEYWPNGKLKAIGQSKNDTLFGWFKFFDSSGVLVKQKEYIYQNGTRLLNQIIIYSNNHINPDSSLYVEIHPGSDTIFSKNNRKKLYFKVIAGNLFRTKAYIKYNNAAGIVTDTIKVNSDKFEYLFVHLHSGLTKVVISIFPHINTSNDTLNEVVREINIVRYINVE